MSLECFQYFQPKFIIIYTLFTSLPIISSKSIDPFKRAINRGYLGFEKENNTEWRTSFHFIQGADTQFGMIESYIQNKTNGGWDEEIGLTEEAIKQWNAMQPKPKFVVICGDLVNDYPFKEQKRRDEQLRDFKKVFAKLDQDIPLVLLGGNHDLVDSPTVESINQYKDHFGDDYFSFWFGGVMFIVINVQYYKDHSLVPDLYREHEEWLDRQLADAKNANYKHIVVFQHIPWFLRDINEPNDYFNIEFVTRQRMIDKFYSAGVRAIFAGHYHRNAGGHYQELEMVVTSAMGAQFLIGTNANSGYRVVEVNENNITHKYVDIVQRNRTEGIAEFNNGVKLVILLCLEYFIRYYVIYQ